MNIFSNSRHGEINNDDLKITRELIDAGADVNVIYNGRTVLTCAIDYSSSCSHLFYTLLKIYIRAGANTELGERNAALHFVSNPEITNGLFYEATFRLLLASTLDLEPLVVPTIENGHSLTILVENGAICKDLINPLEYVLIKSGEAAAVKLIENGCDLSYVDEAGMTTLMTLPSEPIVSAILKRKTVDPLARNNRGETALMIAIMNGRIRCFAPLIPVGIDAEGDALIESLHRCFNLNLKSFETFSEIFENSNVNDLSRKVRYVVDFYKNHYNFVTPAKIIQRPWAIRNWQKLRMIFRLQVICNYWNHITCMPESKKFFELKDIHRPFFFKRKADSLN